MGEFQRAYDSVDEMMKSMPCELQRRVSSASSFHNFTVFWSKNNDELSRLLTDSSITNTCTGTSPMEAIKLRLESLRVENYLVQIWAPVTVGDKRYLTTSDQHFVMAKLVKGLCSYRKQCLDYLIPIDEGHVGPPGRVFLNGLPEVCLDVRHYTTKEYPQRDSAVTYGIRCYLAFPFYNYFSHAYDHVVELVANGFQPVMKTLANFAMDASGISSMFTLGSINTVSEIGEVLLAVCKTHQLPLAQSWDSMPYSRFKNEVRYEKQGSYVADIALYDFTVACGICYIKKGRGVVGRAFSSKGACFCKDISQLSINEYSLVPSARKAGLTGCFAISLRNIFSNRDYLYIVEFFLPSKETENGDPRTLIKMLLATMKQQLKSFEVASGQELGEKLFVEVIKTSPTDELDSFEICDLTGDDSTPNTMGYPYGGEIVQLDNTMGNAENALGGESGEVHRMTPVPASSHPPVQIGLSMPMQFASSSYDNHGFARKMRQERTEAFLVAPSIMDPYAGKDKAKSALHHEGTANVLPDADNLHQHGKVLHFVSATSHAENVNNAEQNIDSIGEIVQLDDAPNNTENMNTNVAEQNDSTEQRDTNSNISENRRAIKRIEREYEITLADLLQHSGKKQEEAANHFGVSRSTFKRICRTHGIFRWPPSKAKKLRCTPQESVPAAERNVEDQRTVYQSVSNLPHLKQDPSCEARALQVGRSVHDRSSMMIKEVDLRSSDIYHDFAVHTSTGPQKAFNGIRKALVVVCSTHQLPLAQTWVPISDSSHISKVRTADKGSYFSHRDGYDFTEACSSCCIQKGQGVVGRAFSSQGACFCKDISQLSINEYSLVSCARKAGLTGCFAICLQYIGSGDYVHIVEFFLPLNEIENGGLMILVEMLLATMKQHLQSFKVAFGQELGETVD